jgi:hypothetical protein
MPLDGFSGLFSVDWMKKDILLKFNDFVKDSYRSNLIFVVLYLILTEFIPLDELSDSNTTTTTPHPNPSLSSFYEYIY